MKNEVNRTLVVKKKITLFFIILLSFLTLGAWNSEVLGKTLKGETGVIAGKGTATVEIFSKWFPVSAVKSTSTEGTYTSVSYGDVDWYNWAYCKFSASPAPGYSFYAWYTNQEGTSGENKSTSITESSVTGNATQKRFVKFDPIQYTITFNKQSGTGGTGSAKVHYDDDDFTVSTVSVPTRTGYTFGGYYTAADGGGVQIVNASGAWQSNKTNYLDANGKWIKAENTTVYAKWTAKTYSVSFNSHGGSSVADKTVTYDATYGTLTNPTRAGYTFNGWFTAETGGTQVTSSTKVQITSAQTLHAHWTANEYTVSFNSHGGSSVANKTVTYDANYGALTNPTRAGYTFDGWFTEEVGGTQVLETNVVKITATQTLHAHWTVNHYNITLNNQSATNAGTENIAVTYDANTNLTSAITTPSKVEYTFEGYYTGTNGGGIQLIDKNGNVLSSVAGYTDASRNWVHASDVTLYAYWKGNQYITWNLLDGLNPRDKYYEYATGETFDATSFGVANNNPTGLTITYTSSDENIATIVDGNKLNVVKANEIVTIIASQSGNNLWNPAAVSVSKTFKTCGAKPDNWNVSATDLVYGQLLEESTLSGVVKLGEVTVPGTLEWVAPTTLPNAGNHNYSVLFTPENEDAYGSVTFDVPVTVAQADPVITWNIGERLRENSRYSNFVTSSNTEAALNISVSNSTLLSIEGNVLTTGEVDAAKNAWIKVSQPASDNYKAVPEQTLNVTVNPKSVVCLPFMLQTESDYNNVVVAENKSAWCNTNEEGHRDNYIAWFDVRYTQRVGIALGTWEDGLSGISWAKLGTLISGGGFAWSSKSVDMSFTGVPDKISFDVESQKVTSTPPDATWKASATDWYLYESADGVNYTQVGDKFVSGHQVRNRQLKVDTRYIRIQYSGNFTGFVKNLSITQKKYLRTDKTSLEFGTEANPLQEPQTLTMSYSSLGSCEIQSGKITATSNNPAFYVDEAEVTENVGIDQMGEYTIRVRCNDVNQEGTLTLTAYDGTQTTVSLRSTKPVITTAHTNIFRTGTEHAAVEGEAYRTQQTIDYTGCFSGSTPVFDTLYIYGVTASSASNRLWENDAIKGYKVPALNVEEGNVHTPCFVYAKSGAQYEYIRTFNAATGSLDIDAAGKKLGFIGYKPVNETVATPAIQLSGATEIYLNNAEIASKGSVMVLNGANTIHARGNNTCSSSNAAAIQLGTAASELTIEDSWTGDATPGKLALIPASAKPSIDLNGANNVIINGTRLELHNADKMAIVHMDGNTEKTDGSVKINDGTIVGESSLGMPQNTLIDGGTFNDGTIVCYNAKGKTVRPFNSRGEVLARAEKEKAELPDWYGKAHLTEVAGRVYPMLFGGEGLSIFENTKSDHDAQNELNWTENPQPKSDAIVAQDMNVTDSLTVNSMTINEGVTVVVKNGAVLTIGDGDSFREQAGNLHIENGGKVVLTTGELIVNDFILDAALGNTSQSAASGQLLDANNMLRLINDAYFQISFDPNGAITYGWYDFTVPFEVDLMTGVFDKNGNKLTYNTDYAVMEYSEAKRAAKAARPWTWFSGTMQPGKLYTITLDDEKNWNTFLFKKKANTAISINDSFNALCTETADTKDKGWNGLGNGMLQHCQLNNLPAQTKIQICDHENERYVERDAADYTYAVGTAFFVQVKEPKTIDLTAVIETRGFLAPMRENKVTDEFRLALIEEGQTAVADHLWVSASEEANGEYVIGRDLLKMGTPTNAKVAQMWASRNEMILCDAEMPLIGNEANVNVSFFAPKNGVYTIGIEKAPEDANLYLTYNDQVIWDLTLGAYTLELAKGTTTGYGLRIEARTPQVATGIESTATDTNSARKVLINNTLYIVTPEGKMYDAVGKSVK